MTGKHSRLTPDELIRIPRVVDVAAAPCGTWLAVCVQRLDPKKDATYTSDLWRVPVAGGAPQQLTRGPAKDSAPCFRSDGALGFLSDRVAPGEEEEEDAPRAQVWALPAWGGEPERITDEPLGVQSFRFAPKGDRLVVMAGVLPGVAHAAQRATHEERRRDGPSALRYDRSPVRWWDHWISAARPHLIALDSAGEHRRDLTPEVDRELLIEPSWALSDDGAVLVTTAAQGLHTDRVEDSAVWVIDTTTGARRCLGAAPSTRCERVVISADGRQVAATRYERSTASVGKEAVWLYDLALGSERELAPEWDRWMTPAFFSADGSELIGTAQEGGDVPVVSIDLSNSSDEVTRLTERAGHHHGLTRLPDGMVAGLYDRFLCPPEPFVMPVGGTPRALSGLSGFDASRAEALARVESVVVPVDGDTPDVQTFVLTPPAPAEGPRPALLWIHGGPIGAWSDAWHWRWNPLLAVARGFVVIAPNPSGSVGFGQSFIDQVWQGQWGGQCYRDVIAACDAVAARPDVDADRIVAMGGSFGGYMTAWIGSQSDRFCALITHAGVFDLSAFHGATDVPGFFALEMGGVSPYEDRPGYDRHSPRELVGGWKSPTLIIHGERDYRVPVSEGLALFEALQRHGVKSELLVFPDENHWIQKPRNIVVWYEAVLEFVERYAGTA